jgi:hypothetical protein
MREEEKEESVGCSDEEVTHKLTFFMICVVHFGDTRYD